jgi:predicted metallopeptidase
MSNRYEDVTEDVKDILKQVREDHFPELAGAEIMCIFDTKKKLAKGKLELASIRSTNDLQKYLTNEITEEECDYIIRIDKTAWNIASQIDKVRIIRHELRHTLVDPEKEDSWKLRGHSIEDFYSEIRLNEDHPRWAQELVGRVMAAYENDEPEANDQETEE